MWSHFNVLFTKDYLAKLTGYYHSISAITFDLAQSDQMKRLLLEQNFHWESMYDFFAGKKVDDAIYLT